MPRISSIRDKVASRCIGCLGAGIEFLSNRHEGTDVASAIDEPLSRRGCRCAPGKHNRRSSRPTVSEVERASRSGEAVSLLWKISTSPWKIARPLHVDLRQRRRRRRRRKKEGGVANVKHAEATSEKSHGFKYQFSENVFFIGLKCRLPRRFIIPPDRLSFEEWKIVRSQVSIFTEHYISAIRAWIMWFMYFGVARRNHANDK